MHVGGIFGFAVIGAHGPEAAAWPFAFVRMVVMAWPALARLDLLPVFNFQPPLHFFARQSH